ncbi:MAG: glycosyltransferase family 2 protein [Xanthobacteraceae bacterium]|nr:glycosyltransferase family 2 protein [Xanthobacteraceae bacterium]
MSAQAPCSPRVAVVTPFCNEPPDWLAQAQRSIAAQTYPCDHIMVGDAASVVPPLPATVVNLPTCVADFGDTPRAVGSFYAVGLGYDAIAYLDADNWFDPEHIASLVTLHLQTNAAVVTSRRAFVRIDGSYMAECTASDGDNFSDTNCLFITRAAFAVLSTWVLMDRAFHAIDDRVIWHAIKQQGYSLAHTGRASVAYRARLPNFYTDLGETPPLEVKAQQVEAIMAALTAWEAAGNAPLRMRWGYRRYAAPNRIREINFGDAADAPH